MTAHRSRIGGHDRRSGVRRPHVRGGASSVSTSTKARGHNRYDCQLSQVIIYIVFVLLLIIIVNSLYWRFVAKDLLIYRSAQEYEAYRNQLRDGRISVAFFGDSHAAFSIQPRFLPSTYNFATGAEGYRYIYHRIRWLVERDNVTLGTVVLEIDPNSFSNTESGDDLLLKDVWYWRRYLSYDEMAAMSSTPKLSLMAYSHLPFVGRGPDALGIFARAERTETYLGWVNFSGVSTEDGRRRNAEALYVRDYLDKPLVNETSLTYFKKILHYANDNNISVVLIRYPLSKEYYDVFESWGVIVPYYDAVFYAANEVGNYTVLDYHALFYDHPEYFSDAEHLSDAGAYALTHRVGKDLGMEVTGAPLQTQSPVLDPLPNPLLCIMGCNRW